MPRALRLTFDDGPDPVWTPSILDELAQTGSRATFFMQGSQIQAAPEVLGLVLEAGHEVQLHCHRHVRHSEMRSAELDWDVRVALHTFEAYGVRPTHWRTPWGVVTDATREIASRRGLTLVGWQIDTHDWRGDSAAQMLTAALPALPHGGAVLMHDGIGPGSRRRDAANTTALVRPLIEAAIDAGLCLLTVGDEPGATDVADALAPDAPTPGDRGALG